MVYWILKPFLQLTIRLFFRNFQINGKEKIPTDRPVLFVSNHPATFMDPIIIAATIRQKVYFISKSTVFKSRFAKWILPRLNMIPIYRKQDNPALMGNNTDTFDKVYQHLNSGKSILIFPEGISLPERKLKEIKTGAARMALGAEDKTGFTSGITIVSIGINYFDNGRFQTNVVINIADPINLTEYKNSYAQNPQNTVKLLTQRIETQLEENTISIEEKETDEFIARIEKLYKPLLFKEYNLDKRNKSSEFFLTKKMLEYLEYFKQNDPWRLTEIRNKTSHYFSALANLNINDEHVRKTQNQKHFFIKMLGGFFYFLLGLPIILTGIVFNIIPYYITDFLAKKISPFLEYRVALSMVLGMFIYIGFYSGYLIGLNYLFNSFWINLSAIIIFPISGLYAYLQLQSLYRMLKRIKLISYFYKRTDEINTLINLRKELIELLEKCRNEVRHDLV